MINRLLEVACSIVLQAPILQTIAAKVSPTPASEILERSFQFSRQEFVEICCEAWWRSFTTLSCSLEPNSFACLDERITSALHQAFWETTFSSFQTQEGLDDVAMQTFRKTSAALARSFITRGCEFFSTSSMGKLDIQELVVPQTPLHKGEVGAILLELLSTIRLDYPPSFLSLLRHQLLIENLFLYFFVQRIRKEERIEQTLRELRELGFWFTLNNPDIAKQQIAQGMQCYELQLRSYEKTYQEELTSSSLDGHFARAQTLLSWLSSLHQSKILCSSLRENNENVVLEAQMAWQALGGTFEHFTARFGDLCEALHISLSSPVALKELTSGTIEVTRALTGEPPSDLREKAVERQSLQKESFSSPSTIAIIEKHVERILLEKIDTLLSERVAALQEEQFEQLLVERFPSLLERFSHVLIRTPVADTVESPPVGATFSESIQEGASIASNAQHPSCPIRTIKDLCRRMVLFHRLSIQPLKQNEGVPLSWDSPLSQKGVEGLEVIGSLHFHGRMRVDKLEAHLQEATGLAIQILTPSGQPAKPNQSIASVKIPGSKWSFVAQETLYLSLKPSTKKQQFPSWRRNNTLSYGKQNAPFFFGLMSHTIQLHTLRGLCEVGVDTSHHRIVKLEALFAMFPELEQGDTLCLVKAPEKEGTYYVDVLFHDLHKDMGSSTSESFAEDDARNFEEKEEHIANGLPLPLF